MLKNLTIIIECRNGQIVLMMFENIKIFVKIDMFTKYLEMKIMKYFPHLQKHFQKTIIF